MGRQQNGAVFEPVLIGKHYFPPWLNETEERKEKTMQFGDLLDTLFSDTAPQDSRTFAELLSRTTIDDDIRNAVFFNVLHTEPLEASRQNDGTFVHSSPEDFVSVQGQVSVDHDGDDINVVVTNLGTSGFKDVIYVRWWALIDGDFESGEARFVRTSPKFDAYSARIVGGAKRSTFLVLSDVEDHVGLDVIFNS
jgi:hypothetical protein